MSNNLKILKNGIISFNFLLFILGVLLFFSSCNFLLNPLIGLKYIKKTFFVLSLIISIILILNSAVGSYGIYYNNSNMIKYYAGTILICMFLNAFVISTFPKVDTDKLGESINKNLIKNYYKIKPAYKKFIDNIQSDYKCCGVYFFLDYEQYVSNLPASCCGSDGKKACTFLTVYQEGCKKYFHSFFKKNKKSYTVALSLSFSIQALVLIFSILLIKEPNQNYINNM